MLVIGPKNGDSPGSSNWRQKKGRLVGMITDELFVTVEHVVDDWTNACSLEYGRNSEFEMSFRSLKYDECGC